MLEFGENIFCDAKLVEFGLNGGNYIVYDSTVDGGLIESSLLPDRATTAIGDQLTTILLDIRREC